MVNWQEGLYNSDYILNQKGLVGQLKFETTGDPARLDEISVEKYDDGGASILFTTHPDAANDSKQGSMHARLSYNTLFQDLQRLAASRGLSFYSSSDEVHCLRAQRGHERLLLESLICLEKYDNSLAEISKQLNSFLSPKKKVRLDEIREAIDVQESRLKLLQVVLQKEQVNDRSSSKAAG